MLTFELSGSNNVVYTNRSNAPVDVTLAASGPALYEIKLPNRTERRQPLPRAGAITVAVPANHVIEVDAVEGVIRLEILAVR